MKRRNEIAIEISSPLTTNGLVMAEYYRRVNIAYARGAPLPDFPEDALVPEAEDAVIGRKTEVIRIQIPPNARTRKAQQRL